MGKPFKQELASIEHTIQWADTVDISHLRSFLTREQAPCILVGSGGSSSASYLVADLLQRAGRICQIVTPLELYHAPQQLATSQVLLISASGRNKDINFALKVAIEQEPLSIGCLTMSCDNPLTRHARQHAICEIFEFAIPTRKDGFLATNTLVGTWAVLLRALAKGSSTAHFSEQQAAITFSPEPAGSAFSTLIVLYGNRGKPVAFDIESKCTEAGLAAVQLADFRNFGHGRHHWIAKHAASTAVVAVVTPGDEQLWAATAAVLPDSVPRLVLSANTELDAYLPLLTQSFHLINYLGELRGIDPGRPGVPEFGRKLYHINPGSYYPLPKLSRRALAVRRKERSGGNTHCPSDAYKAALATAVEQFAVRLAAAKFGSLVIDYDGTLGAKIDKEAPLAPAILQHLLTYLAAGFILGIATGRGKSVAAILRPLIPSVHWSQVLIGYYNGTVIHSLGESLLEEEVSAPPQASLLQLVSFLTTLPTSFHLETRTHQITIQTTDERQKAFLVNQMEAYLAANTIRDISLFTSGRCIDAVHLGDGSKLNVLNACQQLTLSRQLPTTCLCIGDQGRYPGNDFLLLTTPYSLSVDEVSPDLNSCWNLAGLGQRHVAATQQYLDALVIHSSHFSIALPV